MNSWWVISDSWGPADPRIVSANVWLEHHYHAQYGHCLAFLAIHLLDALLQHVNGLLKRHHLTAGKRQLGQESEGIPIHRDLLWRFHQRISKVFIRRTNIHQLHPKPANSAQLTSFQQSKASKARRSAWRRHSAWSCWFACQDQPSANLVHPGGWTIGRRPRMLLCNWVESRNGLVKTGVWIVRIIRIQYLPLQRG